VIEEAATTVTANLFHANVAATLPKTASRSAAAALRLHFFQFVEGAEQPHLDGGVLLGIDEGRPWASAQPATIWCGRKILTA